MADIYKKKHISSIIKHVFYMLGAPIIHELPFFTITVGSWIFLGFTIEMVNRLQTGNFLHFPAFLNSICMGLFLCYIITVLAHNAHYKIIRYGIYSLVFILSFFDYFLVGNFHSYIGAESLRLLAETNFNEASEFISIYLLSTGSIKAYIKTLILIIVFLTFQCIYKKRENHITSKNKLQRVCSIIATFIVGVGIYCCSYFSFLFNLDTTELVTSFAEGYHFKDPASRLIVASRALYISGEEVRKAIDSNNNISTIASNQTTPMNIIVVIGESFSKWHTPLYGYRLNTTPNLLQEQNKGNLIAFDDVVSPSSTTSFAIKNIFSCSSISDGEKWFEHPIFTSIFKEAGWNVYLWDNQRSLTKGNMFTFALNSFLFSPKMMDMAYNHVNKHNFPYDGDLVKDFRYNLSNGQNLVIYHLIGQHARAQDRYPQNQGFDRFSADSIKRNDKFLNEDKKAIIAQYDNATFYNDHVLSMIMKKSNDSNSIIIYLSDHGDEIYDYRDHVYRDLAEELNDNIIKHIYKVPFMVWFSDKFIDENPDIVQALNQAKSRRFESDNLCHMLFNISKISTSAYKPERDILNTKYKQVKRYAYKGSKKYAID